MRQTADRNTDYNTNRDTDRKKKQRGFKIAAGVMGFLMGVGVALALLPWCTARVGSDSLLLMEVSFLGSALILGGVAYLITIAVHEGGHLIAGLCSGYSFVSYRILNLMLIRRDGRLCLKRFKIAGTAGQCLMKPPAWTDRGIPTQLYNWGGVMANLLLCAALLPGVLCTARDSLGGAFLLVLLIINLYTALTNGIPMMNNDGDNALHLHRDRAAQRAFWQQMMANALLAEGTPLRDMPREMYTLPADADLSNPMIATVAMNAADHFLTLGQTDEAEAAARALMENPDMNLPALHRFLLRNNLVFLELLRLGRKSEETETACAEKEYIRYRKAMRGLPDVIRTAYAEALFAGDEAETARQAAAMDRAARSHPYPQDIERERGLMILAEERYRQLRDSESNGAGQKNGAAEAAPD